MMHKLFTSDETRNEPATLRNRAGDALSHAECEVLRGLAILGIVLHNYCHWLPGIVRENEFQFFYANVHNMQQVLAHPDARLPLHIFSFLGHYGVPVFLFLSAYGLVMKYELSSKHLAPATAWHDSWRFVRYHFMKLFRMMIVGFVAFAVVDAMTPGSRHYNPEELLAVWSMTGNLFPGPDKIIWPGPYWFFGLMLQLYIVYRLLLYKRHWGFTVALMVVCFVLQDLFDPESEGLNWYRYNFPGGMLPFGMGLLAARFGTGLAFFRTHGFGAAVLWLLLLGVTYSMTLTYGGWHYAPVMVCAAAIVTVQGILRASMFSQLFRALAWLGKVSSALFVCHPILRKIFIPISKEGDVYTGLMLYTLCSVCVAWLFYELMKRIPGPKY